MPSQKGDPIATVPGLPPGLQGLSSSEARRRLHESGPNRWVRRDPFAGVREIVGLLLDPMAIILVAAATVYFALGESTDAVVMLVALVPVLGVDVALEARSRAALRKLAQAAEPHAEVVRDGSIVAVPLEHVVPGDLLVLREGRVLAADGVVRWSANLASDESSLTGESEPQRKRAWTDEPAAAPADARFFAGAEVLSGHGFGLVTTTGGATQYGGIATLVAEAESPLTPLQRRAGVLVRRLGVFALVLTVAVFAIGLLRGEPWTRALLGAVSLAMATVPAEFTIVLTLFLSVGAWRLVQCGVLVRRLASVETLGSTTVICTDKTGTLTRGEFTMTRHLALLPGMAERELLEAAVLACERHPNDAMERAIVAYADARGVRAADLEPRWTLVRDYDFDEIGKHMSHVWQSSSAHETYLVAAKGAVEGIIEHCRLDDAHRERVLAANRHLAAEGLRVLALAIRTTATLGATREDDERGLVICGLLGFEDPLRPEVPAAVAECQRAGIRVMMITGDHALTAHAVAEAAGIEHEDGAIVTGEQLAAAGDEERSVMIARSAILARTSPAQKYLIVQALQRTGAVVAMTGDGVNDAPALRRADIGIAMGRRGTDVARATADLVLVDDDFAAIVETVKHGRHVLQNIQRAFLYLIAFHIPIVALAILLPILDLPLVLLPIHLVWLQLIVHPVSAIVFQAEPVSGNVMDRPPRDPAEPLLPRPALLRSGLARGLLALATFATYAWALPAVGESQARALTLVTLLGGYQVLVFAERRALPGVVVATWPRTRVFWAVWLATAASLVAVLYAPTLAHLFRVEPPAWPHVLAASGFGAVAVAWRLIGRGPRGPDPR